MLTLGLGFLGGVLEVQSYGNSKPCQEQKQISAPVPGILAGIVVETPTPGMNLGSGQEKPTPQGLNLSLECGAFQGTQFKGQVSIQARENLVLTPAVRQDHFEKVEVVKDTRILQNTQASQGQGVDYQDCSVEGQLVVDTPHLEVVSKTGQRPAGLEVVPRAEFTEVQHTVVPSITQDIQAPRTNFKPAFKAALGVGIAAASLASGGPRRHWRKRAAGKPCYGGSNGFCPGLYPKRRLGVSGQPGACTPTRDAQGGGEKLCCPRGNPRSRPDPRPCRTSGRRGQEYRRVSCYLPRKPSGNPCPSRNSSAFRCRSPRHRSRLPERTIRIGT